MADYREITQELHEVLRSTRAGGRTIDDRTAALLSAYSQACRETYQRLNFCREYLRIGMRTEATQLAAVAPELNFAVRALEFPDWPLIEKASAKAKLPLPPRVSELDPVPLEKVAAEEGAVAPLLAQHRVLALGRAPVREGLRVLRELRTREPNNPFWARSMNELERLRAQQIRTELRTALEKGEAERLDRLSAELAEEGWTSELAGSLRPAVANAQQTLAGARTTAELQRILNELNDAQARKNYDRCVTLLNRWQSTLRAKPDLQLAPSMVESLRVITNWVSGEERRRETFRKMHAAQENLQSKNVKPLMGGGRYLPLLTGGLLVAAGLLAAGMYAYFRFSRAH